MTDIPTYTSIAPFFKEILPDRGASLHYYLGRPERGVEDLYRSKDGLYWNIRLDTTRAHDKARLNPHGMCLTSLRLERVLDWATRLDPVEEDLALEQELERLLWNAEVYVHFDHYFDEDFAHWHVRGQGGWQVAPEVHSRLLECGYTVHKEDAWKLHLRDPHGALILYKHPEYTPVWQSGVTECDDPERGRVWLSEQRASLDRWEYARRALLTGEHFIKYDFDGNVIEQSGKTS